MNSNAQMFTTLSTFWCEFCMLSLFLEYDFQLLNSATWPFYLFPQFRSHCLPPPVRQIHPMNFRFTNSIMTNWTHIFFRHLLVFFGMKTSFLLWLMTSDDADTQLVLMLDYQVLSNDIWWRSSVNSGSHASTHTLTQPHTFPFRFE